MDPKAKVWRGVRRLFLVQSAVVFILAVIFFMTIGTVAAMSCVLGGLVCILPSQLFAWLYFRYRGAHSAQQIVGAFYRGEAVKIFITVALFIIVFKHVAIHAMAFFLGFIVAQCVFWVAPGLFSK